MVEKQSPPQKSKGGYLEALLNSCPVAIIAIDAEGMITFANKEACNLWEREMCDLVGESIISIYGSMETAREANRRLYAAGGIIHDYETRTTTKTGKIIPVRVSAAHLKDSSGNYVGAVGYFERYRPWTAAEVEVKSRAAQLEAELKEWKTLAAPVFELYPGLSVIVAVGRLDAGRLESITQNLLCHIESVETRVVLIDLSAASGADSGVASQLVKTIRTIRLLGAECVLGGIHPSVALAVEPLIADVGSIRSYCSIGIALEAALSIIGFEIRKKH